MARWLLILVLCVGFGPVSSFRAAPEGAADWPEPSQDTLDYLATIDIRTGKPIDPDDPAPSERLDLFGDNLPDGAVARLCYAWSTAHLTLTADGRTAVTGAYACSTGRVDVFDLATGAKRWRLGEHRGFISALACSPDSRLVAVARCGRSDWKDDAGSVTLWDLETGDELLQLGEGTGPRALAFAPDGTLASGGGDGRVWLWDVESGEPSWLLADQGKYIRAIAFSPDGKLLAAASRDDRICLYELATGKQVRELAEPAPSLAFSPDGRYLAAGTAILDVATGRLRRFGDKVGGVAFSPDGRTLAIFDKSGLRIAEFATGHERKVLRVLDEEQKGYYPEFKQTAFTPDGRKLVSSDKESDALVWDVTGFDRPGGPPRVTQAQVVTLVEELAVAGPVQAHGLVWKLALAPDASLPYLQRRLRQPVPGEPNPHRIGQLIANLDHNDFLVRQQASLDLERLGTPAADALRDVLAAKPSLEVKLRAERILEGIESRHGLTREQLLRLRTVEVLEHIGSPAARALLSDLKTADAKESLERLKRKPVEDLR